MSIAKSERFFRVAAGLDVDKSDLKRYSDFVNQKIYDLLLRGQATAKANGRDIIEPFDVSITKGLQERIHDFRNIDEEIELKPILDYMTSRPPLDLAYSEETEAQLPDIVGGLSVALARTFKIIDPDLKNPRRGSGSAPSASSTCYCRLQETTPDRVTSLVRVLLIGLRVLGWPFGLADVVWPLYDPRSNGK